MFLFQGFLFPALHALVAHWAPPAEKGKFVSALLGGAIGTVVTWSLTGPLIENFGWDYAFYVPGKYQLYDRHARSTVNPFNIDRTF